MLSSMIGALIIGLGIGAAARALLPGPDPLGCFATALLGIGGSIVGGLIGSALWPVTGQSGFTHPRRLLHFVLSVVGAVILLAFWRTVVGRRS
ncbi:MAG TPA: GlsB/YeaQ/YmgE family stress response membrane protein [Blastocatellia bacterium]|nr:GlsB/YeaQ/YmgE family stress response membrane protein [Blastocatellia bacterium]